MRFLLLLLLLLLTLPAKAQMKVYVQFARNPVQDWIKTDCAAWKDLPYREIPRDGRDSQLDDDLDTDGWISAVLILGTIIRGWDHYALEVDGEGCRVTGWNDDPEDFPVPWAEVGVFLPPARDPKIGGRYNTRNFYKRYISLKMHERPGAQEFHPWSEFSPPADESVIRHGVTVSNELWQLHRKRWTEHVWREWTEGLPAEDIVDGLIVRDSPSHSGHSVTRFLVVGAQANGVHAASDELAMSSSAGAGETISENVSVGTDELTTVWTLNEEAGGTWESNAAVSFELSVGDATGSGGFLSVGGSDGHAACVNTGLTTDTEVHTQNEGAFTMDAGIKPATFTTTWSTCNTTDKFEALLAVSCDPDHGNCSLTWVFDSSSEVTVPYPAAAAVTPKRRIIVYQ